MEHRDRALPENMRHTTLVLLEQPRLATEAMEKEAEYLERGSQKIQSKAPWPTRERTFSGGQGWASRVAVSNNSAVGTA